MGTLKNVKIVKSYSPGHADVYQYPSRYVMGSGVGNANSSTHPVRCRYASA